MSSQKILNRLQRLHNIFLKIHITYLKKRTTMPSNGLNTMCSKKRERWIKIGKIQAQFKIETL